MFHLLVKKKDLNAKFIVNFATGLTATALRPMPARHTESPPQTSCQEPLEATGHRIINVETLIDFFNETIEEHNHVSPECKAKLFFPAKEEVFQGMSSSIAVSCHKCSFRKKPYALFRRVKLDGGQRGHSEVNVRAAAYHITHPGSYQDTIEFPVYMDTPTITECGLSRIVGKVKGPMLQLGLDTMADNCRKAAEITKLLNVNSIPVGTDTAYNNPPKGRGFQTNGTQSTTPMHEMLTRKQLVLSLESYSQICTCANKNEPCRESCPANIPRGYCLGSFEGQASQNNLQKIKTAGLVVGTIVADNSHQIMAHRKDPSIKKEECIVHMSRAQERKVFSLKFAIAKNPKVCKKLSRNIVERCKSEMTMARRHFANNVEYIKHMAKVCKGLVPCMRGDHGQCKNVLFTCRKGKRLDAQLEWNMLEPDAGKLQEALNYKLSSDRIIQQLYLRSTNKTEALHRRMQRLNPKWKTNKTTFHHRNHHAVTLDSLGHKNGTIAFLQRLDLNVSQFAVKTLSRIERKTVLQIERTRSLEYKRRRVYLKSEKLVLRAQAIKESKKQQRATKLVQKKPAAATESDEKNVPENIQKESNKNNKNKNLFYKQTIVFERSEISCTTRSGRVVREPKKPNM